MRPAFEHFTLGEITTGRVEWFLRRQAALSYGQAKHTRTLLNQLCAFAQRHDAIARNPVEGTYETALTALIRSITTAKHKSGQRAMREKRQAP